MWVRSDMSIACHAGLAVDVAAFVVDGAGFGINCLGRRT